MRKNAHTDILVIFAKRELPVVSLYHALMKAYAKCSKRQQTALLSAPVSVPLDLEVPCARLSVRVVLKATSVIFRLGERFTSRNRVGKGGGNDGDHI